MRVAKSFVVRLDVGALQGAHVGVSLRTSLPREPDKALPPLTVAVDVAFEGLEVHGLIAVVESSPVAVMGSNRVDKVGAIC